MVLSGYLQMGDSSNAAADTEMAASSNLEAARDTTPSSLESTPEHEAPPTEEAQSEAPMQPQKRKGGRKPIYATSEERKQRNRQAQAAFRERRTEYIKQLEATIKQNEETLATLQQSHRSAADECLMLRYKNSLLERILLEKGIDVQAELQMKTGSPTFGPGFMHPAAAVPHIQPPLQRTALQRQHARRSGQKYLAKDGGFPSTSPQGQPTPSSHASSPNSLSHRSPVAVQQQQQGGMTPPASSILAQPHAQQFSSFPHSQQPPHKHSMFASQQHSPQSQRHSAGHAGPPMAYQSSASSLSNQSMGGIPNFNQPPPTSAGPPPAASFYASPFQRHIDQLEQEYDAQHHASSMLDPPDSDPTNDPSDPDQHHTSAPFGGQLPGANEYYQPPQSGIQQQMTPSTQYSQLSHGQQPTTSQAGNPDFQSMAQNIDPSDPMLDADPFGLSASMHYPTAYSFDQPPQR